MGKYVQAAERRAVTSGRRSVESLHGDHNLNALPEVASKSGCPFAGVFGGGRSVSLQHRGEKCSDDGNVPDWLTETDGTVLSVLDVLSRDERVSSELAVNLVMALFRTGIDSTGNALAFFLHNLASNPDKQEILYKEIEEMTSDERAPRADEIQRMTYLKASLRESFRLNYPVFGGSGRVMPEDTVFSGYNVPKGVFIFANMAAMSRMEEYFPRPLEYHPERWLRDERAKFCTSWPRDSAFLSLPFSHGLRACPGKRFAEQGLYTAVIAILRKYRLETDKKEIGMIHMPFTIPDRPLAIKFKSRK